MEGLKAIKELKKNNFRITATAVVTEMQGCLAFEYGVDYIAPYYNRMEDNGIDPVDTITGLRTVIEKNNYQTKILAASFRNNRQIRNAVAAGAHAVTISPALLEKVLISPLVQSSVETFAADWKNVFGNRRICDLVSK